MHLYHCLLTCSLLFCLHFSRQFWHSAQRSCSHHFLCVWTKPVTSLFNEHVVFPSSAHSLNAPSQTLAAWRVRNCVCTCVCIKRVYVEALETGSKDRDTVVVWLDRASSLFLMSHVPLLSRFSYHSPQTGRVFWGVEREHGRISQGWKQWNKRRLKFKLEKQRKKDRRQTGTQTSSNKL